MSLLDKASLVVTPNAYKESKLYSVVPSDGSGDMTVVRATTATRINSANLVEVVPRNLLQYSEQIDNAIYTKINFNITANALAAPNGTTTADKVIPTTTNSAHVFYQAVPTGVYGFSIYAKAAEETTFSMWLNDLSKRAIFDLTTGTITSSNVTSSNITSVGNGWFRCTIYDTTSTSLVAVYARSGNGFAGNNSDGMYFWGAQAETSTTATDYFPTTTRLNIPRIDYTNGSCPSLLVEPQRTNATLRSDDFGNGYWGKFNTTITANAIAAPDGTTTADKIVETTANNFHSMDSTFSSGTGIYTASIYAKVGERRYLRLNITEITPAVDHTALFDLQTGTLLSSGTGVTASIINAGNGWYRIIVTSPALVGGQVRMAVLMQTTTSVSPQSYLGDGTSGLYIWGAQLEAGSYPTSYIPTVASAVTRNADVISKTGISSLIGQTEGTIYAEIKVSKLIGTASRYIFHISDGTANNRIYMAFSGASSNVLRGRIFSGGTLQCSIDSSTITTTGTYKLALAYKNNDIVFYINGVQIGVDTSATIPTCSRVDIGHNYAGASQLGDGVANANIFKTRLTNTELAQLTTL